MMEVYRIVADSGRAVEPSCRCSAVGRRRSSYGIESSAGSGHRSTQRDQNRGHLPL